MRYLKATGLSILVITVFSAFVGGAMASAAEFHATANGVAISGEQSTSLKFTTTGSSITCRGVRFAGTAEGTAYTTQKVHPEFSECTSFGFVGSVFNTLGCQFNFHTQTGTVDLDSCTNGAIVVTSSSAFGKCVMEVPNQTGINGQSWATEGTSPNRDIRWTTNATNIKDKVTTSTGICPINIGEHTNASLTGTTTLTAASGEIWYA